MALAMYCPQNSARVVLKLSQRVHKFFPSNAHTVAKQCQNSDQVVPEQSEFVKFLLTGQLGVKEYFEIIWVIQLVQV